MRKLLLIFFLLLHLAVAAQRPNAVQIFTISEYVSMFKTPGEFFMDHNGLIWFGSENKLVSFDGFHYTSYRLPDGITPFTDHAEVQFCYQDRSGSYWVYLNNNGLYNFDPQKKKFDLVEFSKEVLDFVDPHQLNAKLLLEDSKGRLWLSLSDHGLFSIDQKTKQQVYYNIDDKEEVNYYVSASWLNKGIETGNGDLYFGTNDGLIEIDTTGKMFLYKDKNPAFPPHSRCIITGIAQDVESNGLLLTCWGTAMKRFDLITKTFTTFLMENRHTGYTNIVNDIFRLTDSTYFIIKRDEYAATGFGIFNGRTQQYKFLHDLEPTYVSRQYYNIIPDGDFLWVSNLNQLYRFYLPALKGNEGFSLQTKLPEGIGRPLKLKIVELAVNNEQRETNNEKLILANNENNLNVGFSCPGATMNDSMEFAYRLKGYETSWHVGRSTSIQYNNLSHGKYVLEIKATKTPYTSQPPELKLDISIAARWWQTWLFKGAIVGLLIVAGIGLYRWRIRIIKEKAALQTIYEKKIAEVEMKALRAQMNPHFIFNCLNSINRYIVKSDHITASNYLTRFSKLIRMILDNSASGIITLQTEIESLELYIQMEAMRFQGKFDYSIRIDDTVSPDDTMIPSMLVQPYVENAIWHGLLHKQSGDCILNIRFSNGSPGTLKIIIEDNGIGRAAAQAIKSKEAVRNKSKGLQITNDRLELIKNLYDITATAEITDLYNADNLAAGTRVTVTLPLMKHKKM